MAYSLVSAHPCAGTGWLYVEEPRDRCESKSRGPKNHIPRLTSPLCFGRWQTSMSPNAASFGLRPDQRRPVHHLSVAKIFFFAGVPDRNLAARPLHGPDNS